MMEFSTELDLKKKKIEEVMRKFAPEMKGEQRLIAEAMNYSFLAGGKRIRPLIMEEVFSLFGGKNDRILVPFMAAIEMIHAYSLIHDDLPAMDNDEFRRGRPTNHRVYGEALAILAGDALLNYAYETALLAFREAKTQEEFERIVKALNALSEHAGIRGMVTGQVIDIEASKNKTKEGLERMYKLKTGALLCASFMIGAILAGASEEKILCMKETGEAVGLSFQLTDDLLDLHGEEGIVGKSLDSDERNQKLTLLKWLGEEQAVCMIEELSIKVKETIEEEIKKNTNYDGFLLRLLTFLEKRNK